MGQDPLKEGIRDKGEQKGCVPHHKMPLPCSSHRVGSSVMAGGKTFNWDLDKGALTSKTTYRISTERHLISLRIIHRDWKCSSV